MRDTVPHCEECYSARPLPWMNRCAFCAFGALIWALGWIAIILLVASLPVAAYHCAAHAQDTSPRQPMASTAPGPGVHGVGPGGLAVELVRVWRAEAGSRSPRSNAGIAHALQRNADRFGGTLIDAADREVWRHSNAQVTRPWLRYLTARCDEPDLYPGRWSRADCVALFEQARAFLRGEVRDPCPRATGWRTRGKALRGALRRGCERLWCGTTVAFVDCRKARRG